MRRRTSEQFFDTLMREVGRLDCLGGGDPRRGVVPLTWTAKTWLEDPSCKFEDDLRYWEAAANWHALQAELALESRIENTSVRFSGRGGPATRTTTLKCPQFFRRSRAPVVIHESTDLRRWGELRGASCSIYCRATFALEGGDRVELGDWVVTVELPTRTQNRAVGPIC